LSKIKSESFILTYFKECHVQFYDTSELGDQKVPTRGRRVLLFGESFMEKATKTMARRRLWRQIYKFRCLLFKGVHQASEASTSGGLSETIKGSSGDIPG